MWNATTGKRLDEWYQSEQGSFVLSLEHSLFQRMVSHWPRRGRALLEIGCGTGVFLKMFWEYGFDVTGADLSEELLDIAQERMGEKADFRLGQLDDLPFDDGDFDYVALLSILEYVENPKAVLTEAMRIASRGVILGFMNRWSLYHLFSRLPWCKAEHDRQGRWFSVSEIAKMATSLWSSCRITSRSVLFGPPKTWKKEGKLNTRISRLPFGAYTGLCIDKGSEIPLTPLLRKVREQAAAVCSQWQAEPASNRTRQAPISEVFQNQQAKETAYRVHSAGRK